MLITGVRIVEQDAGVERQAEVRCDTKWICDGKPFHRWYRFAGEWGPFLSPERGDPFLAACLGPAMVLGEPLEIEGPVWPQLLRASDDIQAILRSWYPQ